VDEPFIQHIIRKGTDDKDRETARIHTRPGADVAENQAHRYNTGMDPRLPEDVARFFTTL